MKKITLITIILATFGGLITSLGMCMCLIKEWNTLTYGIIIGIIGILILLAIIPINLKDKPKKERKQLDIGLIITWISGIIGCLIMGFGISKVIVDNPTKSDMIIGLITGSIGLCICILNYPIFAYIRNKQ